MLRVAFKPDFGISSAQLLRLCSTLCDPKDHSLPDSSIHGNFPATFQPHKQPDEDHFCYGHVSLYGVSIFFLFLAGSALNFLNVQKKNVESHFSVVSLSFLRLSGASVALVCSV